MAENKLKEENNEKAPSKKKAKRRRSKRSVLPPVFTNFSISAYYIFKNIHFVFYLAFLGIIYIANSHYAVETVKEIREVQKDLEKVSWESNARKSELMFESMQSRVATKVDHLGLKPLEGKPRKIEIKDND